MTEPRNNRPETAPDPLAALEVRRLQRLQQRLAGVQEPGAPQDSSPLATARAAAAGGVWSGPRRGARLLPRYSLT